MLGTHTFPKHFLDCTMKRRFVTLFLVFIASNNLIRNSFVLGGCQVYGGRCKFFKM